jgi:hypothetical protein
VPFSGDLHELRMVCDLVMIPWKQTGHVPIAGWFKPSPNRTGWSWSVFAVQRRKLSRWGAEGIVRCD